MRVSLSGHLSSFDSISITFSGNSQVILALLTCNSLVVVTYLFRVWRNRKRHIGSDNSNDESDDATDTSGAISPSQAKGVAPRKHYFL
ncbi:hypothetical protein FA15DRAFT_673686, partial [Coprinopsis marcescibilis]